MALSSSRDLPAVRAASAHLQDLLQQARTTKQRTTVNPPLTTSDLIQKLEELREDGAVGGEPAHRFAALDAAARELFYPVISSTNIEDPAFVEVWNLLDVLQFCEDQSQSAPELVCQLIEELLDSQTTEGCRIVFDYLESRRERLAHKDFHKKTLVFLRSCNELLRRLSRTEDAIFCGRVFFFLFQTFPLGDKSSVNLRGEFHVENTTKFEVVEPSVAQDVEKMDVDVAPVKVETEIPKAGTPQPPTKPGSKAIPIKAPPKEEEIVLSSDELYPIFWRLQQDFCEPTRLFDQSNFGTFKKGLDCTLKKFKQTPTVVQTRATESGPRGKKRKNGEDTASEQSADNYNPKYLTSRDLFDLELSDMAFQRHILVQAMILIDFLLSLTEKAKKKIAALDPTNKSMLYAFTLGEEDSKWALETRSTITNYLSTTIEGRLFNRMVETVLARDKNWVRWKVESCPSIVREPVSAESEIRARNGAKAATRVRALPREVGNIDFSFLDEGSGGGLHALSDPKRYQLTDSEALLKEMKGDELDLEMESDEIARTNLTNAIANKRWRIVRQLRANKLQMLDKIEPGKDIDSALKVEEQHTKHEEQHEAGDSHVIETNGVVHLNGDVVTVEVPDDVNAMETDQPVEQTTNGRILNDEQVAMETESVVQQTTSDDTRDGEQAQLAENASESEAAILDVSATSAPDPVVHDERDTKMEEE